MVTFLECRSTGLPEPFRPLFSRLLLAGIDLSGVDPILG